MKSWQAPFNAYIVSIAVETGDVVSPGQTIAIVRPTTIRGVAVPPDVSESLQQAIKSPIPGYALIYPGVQDGIVVEEGTKVFSILTAEDKDELSTLL